VDEEKSPRDADGNGPQSPLAPPPRRRGLAGNPVMIGVLVVLALAVVLFVVLLAID
jgi:hypothetical protein